MDTKKYEVFEKTVELSSLTKAAEELGLTQSGVSHIIAALEEEFGFPLLTRSRTGARLTPEGEKIMPFLRDILRSQEQLDQTAAELRGLSAGTVRIATFTSVAVHWLPGMMQEFQTLYPHVEFKLFNGDYGRYGNGRGDMNTCFLSTNDITGGNSGSGMFNGRGELIGLAFDGNWEAMSGDLVFSPKLQRCIGVDIRYVLFVIERYGHADRLIKELKLK